MAGTVAPEMVDYIFENLEALVRGGFTVEAAVAQIRRNPMGTPPEEGINAAVDRFHNQANLIINFDTAESIADRERATGGWYTGPDFPQAIYWPPLKKKIEAKIGPAVEEVDKASSQVVASLRPAADSEIDTRGLVLGYVQSGKTTNFLSVMAKAADIGYRFFIVLTGITESLRTQTQERIEQQLVDHTPHWYKLTTQEFDFRDSQDTARQNATSLLSAPQTRVLAVVKKNVSVLRKLNDFIKRAGIAADQCPILIIDDEADQASISVSKEPDEDPSAINAQIRQLLGNEKTAYVAYTATPFANILVNPNTQEDIYPRDFIHVLPKPKGYFGTEAIFGKDPQFGEALEESDGIDMIREIPDNEADALRPPRKKRGEETLWSPYIPESLVAAVRWFILASAARRARGTDSHSSMLIHTAMTTEAHDKTAQLLDPVITQLKENFLEGSSLSLWEDLWDLESASVPAADFGNPLQSFDEVAEKIPEVFEDLKLIIDNSTSEERLIYKEDEPVTVIAIGGNTLSRGLTLEGLICSYFVRSATAYDTLLQMGRWFGFRKGYEDLPRIWLTEDLQYWFRTLALVESDLRQDFSRYSREGLTPLDFQARIRLTPGMEVTNRAKQQNMKKADVSFSGQKVQTILFNHKDRDWLQHNLDATRRLADDLSIRQVPRLENQNGTVVFRGVHNDSVLAFLEDYQIQEGATLSKNGAGALLDYIRKEQAEKSIREWNISFFGKKPDKDGDPAKTIDLGIGKELNLVTRSQMMNSKNNVANIKTLVGSLDRINDALLNSKQLKQLENRIVEDDRSREKAIIDAHAHYLGSDVAHLTVYAIDKDSETRQSPDFINSKGEPIHARRRRKNLEALEHMIGIGIFFPESTRPGSSVEYACVIAPEPETLARYEEAEETIISTSGGE